MKHYKDANNKVFAYEEDGSQDHLIPPGLIPIDGAELAALITPPPLTQEQLDAKATAEANIALRALSLESIPHIMEYIANKPDAPVELKALNAQIKAEKAKPKK